MNGILYCIAQVQLDYCRDVGWRLRINLLKGDEWHPLLHCNGTVDYCRDVGRLLCSNLLKGEEWHPLLDCTGTVDYCRDVGWLLRSNMLKGKNRGPLLHFTLTQHMHNACLYQLFFYVMFWCVCVCVCVCVRLGQGILGSSPGRFGMLAAHFPIFLG